MSWAVERHLEDAATFHARELPDEPTRSVWVCDATGPALVLGSAQPEGVADAEACDRAGVAVVRRRSGGGAVLVEPGGLLWVDVVVPAGDALWDDDVGRAFLWLGETWRSALADLDLPAAVHGGGLVRGRWSDLVCFAGLGPGELTAPGGAKVVGMSQRRTRAAARFQCAALLRWDPAALLALLAMSDRDRAEAQTDLAGAAAGLAVDPGSLLDAVLRRLP